MNTLFTYFSFDKDGQPYYRLTNELNEVTTHYIKFGTDLTLEFDTSQRFCTGGSDLGTYDSWPCPDRAKVDTKYSQCRRCMGKTGFNPAFYYSDTISDQQAEYNQQPHGLYLAYFDDDNLKIGMSHNRRGLSRLLEQGARAAIVLGEFATANVARQYEAKLVRLPWLNESLTLSKKIDILSSFDYSAQHAADQLRAAVQRIATETSLSFELSGVDNLNRFYGDTTDLQDLNDMSGQAIISGKVRACVGSLLVANNDDNKLLLPLKKFVGYRVTVSNVVKNVELAPKQFTLF
ncbi:MAG: DUF2797 domain-containing protein [Candidatus Nomurabacteria bacterium]|jgi:hypothetical protein|nr:DUF2797 domain-containing protein [Candidatus Nomurabacteria bacterium]